VSATSYEARRALERALHDGVQQQLLALAVNLQLARELCERDPAAASDFLEELRRDVHAALDDIRRLGNEVYPAVLADHGVAEALRASGVRVEDEGIGRHPTEVEGAAYFACVAAHAVRLWEEHNSLRFELLD
jgi:signal transduction histidine kinase